MNTQHPDHPVNKRRRRDDRLAASLLAIVSAAVVWLAWTQALAPM